MRKRRNALSAVLAGLAVLTWITPASASTASTSWQAAQSVALPHGATGVPDGYLPALSCVAAGYCVGGGAFTDAAGNTQGLIISEVDGTWRTPTKLLVPTNAATNPAVTITSVSCAKVNECSLVGSYTDTHGDGQALVDNEVNGVWARSLELRLPAHAIGTGQNADLHFVDCATPSNCVAVGTYLDRSAPVPHDLGLLSAEVNGTWHQASQVALPANANLNPYFTIGQVVCPAASNCTAVGSYVTRGGVSDALVLDEVHGAWHTSALALPANANAFATASLSEVSCVSTGDCTAMGNYTNNLGRVEPLVANELLGSWSRGTTFSMPSGAAANPRVFLYGYGGLSCSASGSCSAGGQYLDAHGLYQGFLVNEVHGAWDDATSLALPTGAQAAGQNGGVVAVSCRSVGNCSAGAAYLDGSGDYQALIVNEVNGVWGVGQRISLPASATTVGIDGGVYALSCHASGPCTATGSYESGSSTYEGFTVSTS